MAEKQVEEIVLVYTCPAIPPEDIKVCDNFLYGKDTRGTYLVVNGVKRYEKIEFIKTYFTPLNGKW